MDETVNNRSKEEQRILIEVLTENLTLLRVNAGISRSDLADIIGISRRSYTWIENGKREMPWKVYLSLILFFDYNGKTHDLLRVCGIYPEELIRKINNNSTEICVCSVIPDVPECITKKLDEQAYRLIRNVAMIEYARCENLTSEDVLRLYNRFDENEQ